MRSTIARRLLVTALGGAAALTFVPGAMAQSAPTPVALSPVAVAAQERPIRFASAMPAAGGTLVLAVADAAALGGLSLPAATLEAVRRGVAAAEYEFGANATLTLHAVGGYDKVVLAGRGTGDDVVLPALAGAAVGRAIGTGAGAVTVLAPGIDTAGLAEMAAGLRMGGYQPALHRAPAKAAATPGTVTIVTRDAGAAEAAWSQRGQAVAEAVAFTRTLTNEPANVIYPESFVARTRAAFAGVPGVTIEVLDERQMAELGMGGILSVGRGSARPPRMLMVRYRGAGAPAGGPVVLAGKGITFDSGGISLKPGAGMDAMKMDMAGAASVTGAVLALARGRAPVDVVSIAALAENMPSGSATRPGDVVRAMNGKTIEVFNTDAEGRMVLSDALSYAQARLAPAAVVDVATLTGAIGTALGGDYAGLFSRHDGLARQIERAADATGEAVWRMPLHPSNGDAVKSKIADIRQGSSGGGTAGASVGAWFIGEFVDRATPWAHLDIAGVESADASATHPGGATGWGVRMLERFVRDFNAGATR